MKNNIQESIDAIDNNLSILPIDTKKNKEEYIKYVDMQIEDFNSKLKEVLDEMDTRYSKYIEKYTTGSDVKIPEEIDVLSLKKANNNFDSDERMNLPHYFYEIGHYYKEDLTKVNEIIFAMIDAFSKVGVRLTIGDFNYTEIVYKYMSSLLNKKEDITTVFESLYWEYPNLINQIELNFRYLYFKYKKKIDMYYKKNDVSFSGLINKIIEDQDNFEKNKHTSVKYLSSLILNKKISLVDISEKNIKSILSDLSLDDDQSNYNNLLKLEDSLLEYKQLNNFMFIIDDIKKLFETRQEYKGIYLNKYKEISKKERELFKLNRRINSRFSNGIVKLNRNNCISELYKLYRELDELKIKDIVFNKVNNDTNYYNLLLIATSNFNYFVRLLKEQNDDITIDEIDNNIVELFKFVYCNKLNIVTNITITEDKNISQIISDRYKLVNINVQEDKITEDSIDQYIKNLKYLITSYDIANNNIVLDELEYIMYVMQMKEK